MGPTVALSFSPTLTSCDNYWELVPMARLGRGSLAGGGGGLWLSHLCLSTAQQISPISQTLGLQGTFLVNW